MTFHENPLLAYDSHEISFRISFENWEKISQNLLSAAAVIGPLRVNFEKKNSANDNKSMKNYPACM